MERLPNGMVLHNEEPKEMHAMITHKPPGPGDTYEGPQVIPLLDEQGNDTGFALGPATHVPNPKEPPKDVEVDHFPRTGAVVGILPPGSSPGDPPMNIVATGPTTINVYLNSLKTDPATGLESVDTEIVSMQLTGSTPLGPVQIVAGSDFGLPSPGFIEEKENRQPGRLDLEGPDAPFCTPPLPSDCFGTQANSHFDVNFAIDMPDGNRVFGQLPLDAMIDSKPPEAIYEHVQNTLPIDLVDANGVPTGWVLVSASHDTRPEPPPHFVELDEFPQTVAEMTPHTARSSSAAVRSPSH